MLAFFNIKLTKSGVLGAGLREITSLSRDPLDDKESAGESFNRFMNSFLRRVVRSMVDLFAT